MSEARLGYFGRLMRYFVTCLALQASHAGLQSVGAELHPEDLRGLGSQPQSLALPVNIQEMETNDA